MGLNHLLLFLVLASSALVIVRGFRAPAAVPWKSAVAVVLLTAAAWVFARRFAGYIAFIAWLSLLLLPAIISNPAAFRRLRFSRITPAVLILILLNAGMFVFVWWQSGWQPGAVGIGEQTARFDLALHRYGELDPVYVTVYREYWRFGAALFLHYGALHLLMNLLGLYVLGPALEAEIGAARFTISYLLSGLASTAGVYYLMRHGWIRPASLVGASGSIMGIVGAWAGYLLLHRDRPFARQRLLNIAFIVVTQTAFDYLTPQVSMSAHLCGLAAGVVLGLLIARPKAAAARRTLLSTRLR